MSAVARRVVRVSIPMPLSPHAAPFVKGSGDQKDGGGDGHSNKKRRVAVVERKLFCDLDGVLCDFDRGCVKVMGTTPDQLSKKSMWTGLAKARSFYGSLDWMSDGRELWENIVELHPTVLTGLPMGTWAEPQKRAWCKRELGGDIPVITCMSRDKHRHCKKGSVLIDDRLSLKEAWEESGGVFIHHTSATSSLEELRALLQRPPLGHAGGVTQA